MAWKRSKRLCHGDYKSPWQPLEGEYAIADPLADALKQSNFSQKQQAEDSRLQDALAQFWAKESQS